MTTAKMDVKIDRSFFHGKTEWIAGIAVMVAVVAIGFWLLNSNLLSEPGVKVGHYGGERPTEIVGEGGCRPGCRSTFAQCKVTSGGFVRQVTRCHKLQKICLMSC